MIQVDNSPAEFAIYSGDIDQNGIIDGSDLLLIDNGAANFVSGYVREDCNGDNFVDGTDGVIAGNNSENFIIKITP
jgi:hypothetical protein